jgi:hypothetical protein
VENREETKHTVYMI